MKLEDIFTAEELASIDAGTYDIKKLAAKLDYCVALEREACAKVCDKEMDDWDYQSVVNVALNNCAAAIRARGE